MRKKSALIALIISCNALAEPMTCEEKFGICKEVVRAGHQVIQAQGDEIKKYTELVQVQQNQIDLLHVRLKEVAPSWYERPEFVIPVTAVITAIVVGAVAK